MSIVDDFFMLVWDEKPNQHIEFDDARIENILAHNSELFCDGVAIVLIINPYNLEKIVSLAESKTIINDFFGLLSIDKTSLQQAQKTLLLFLIKQGNNALNTVIAKRIDLLRKEEIVLYDFSRRMISLISLIEEKKVESKPLHVKAVSTQENFYKTSLAKFLSILDNLKACIPSQILLEKLEGIPQKLESQSFSIGITGVMNAGKSTFLNALLGQDILGTAVVPETANLTIIKYAKEPYALVNYEDKQERIAVNEIAGYTSARDEKQRYSLVKSVELYTDLKFVQEGVIIVDTPGLDDPIVEREEMTLSYLDTCDLVIHLMNAAQVATKKDIDFIIDAIVYRNVAQLLIVITRIDMISHEALQEVIDYTKARISARLEEQNRAFKLDDIISKIVFIPLAGKLALMHKIGKADEAIALGYDMEKTGLPLLERYLEDILFGEKSQKANLIIKSTQKEIEHIALASQNILEQEHHLLSLSSEEMAQEIASHQKEKQEIEQFLERLNATIAQMKVQLESYCETLKKFAIQKMDSLQSLIWKRVLEDVNYTLLKQKQLPKNERIAYMIEAGIKDGLVDLMRDYRYEFDKKMLTLIDYIQVQYPDFKVEERIYDGENKSVLVHKNCDNVIQKSSEVIHKYAKNQPNELSSTLEKLLKEEFLVIKEMLFHKLKKENEELLNIFVALCSLPSLAIEEQMRVKEEIATKAVEYMHNTTLNKEVRIVQIEAHLRDIAKAQKALV